MEDNLIIDDVINVFEGEFKPGYIKRTEPRRLDGFCLYLEGEADYIFSEETLTVRGGDVIFLPEDGNYNIMVKKPCSHIWIDFSFVKKGLAPYVFHNVKGIKNDFYKFYYNWMNESPIKNPRAFELINRIYCKLILSKNKTYSKSREIFSRAIEIILKNYKDPDFTVESLANSLNVSTVHLRRIFSHHSDKSPVKYINDMRFEQAKILLASSNLTVGEIALSLGFTDQFHFSKSFKLTIGLTPSDYRQQYKK